MLGLTEPVTHIGRIETVLCSHAVRIIITELF
jgi:hypothetical protein